MTEAKKERAGKPDLSLIPYCAEVELAKAMEYGERKYGRYNYCSGHQISDLVAAAKRHLGRYLDGEERDEESGAHHLGHVMANAVMLLHQIELGTLRDNRFKKTEPATAANETTQGVKEGNQGGAVSEKIFNVVARGSYTKAQVVLATYDNREMAEHMLSKYYVHHWPSFALSVEEEPG